MSVRLVEQLGPPPPAASPHAEAIEPSVGRNSSLC